MQGITCLDALDLLRVTTEDDASRLLLRQPEQFPHLPAGNHSCLIQDQDLPAERCMAAFVLEQGSRVRAFGKPTFCNSSTALIVGATATNPWPACRSARSSSRRVAVFPVPAAP